MNVGHRGGKRQPIPAITPLQWHAIGDPGRYDLPQQMYIGLYGQQSVADFTRVAVVPEVGALPVWLALAGWAFLNRRRQCQVVWVR